MSKYLLKTTEVYRVDMEEEAEKLVAEEKEGTAEVTETNIKKKTTKDDEYFLVTIKKTINNEKTPV